MNNTFRLAFSVLVIFALAIPAFADEDSGKDPGSAYARGNLFLSGGTSLGFAMGTNTLNPDGGEKATDKHNTLNLDSRVGYFFGNRWEIGLGGNWTYDLQTDEDDNKTISYEYLAGVQAAYFYPLNAADPFVSALAGYGGSGSEFYPDGGSKTSTSESGFAFDLALGINVLAGRTVGLAPQIFYKHYWYSGTDDNWMYASASGDKTDFTDTGYRVGVRLAVNLFLHPAPAKPKS